MNYNFQFNSIVICIDENSNDYLKIGIIEDKDWNENMGEYLIIRYQDKTYANITTKNFYEKYKILKSR